MFPTTTDSSKGPDGKKPASLTTTKRIQSTTNKSQNPITGRLAPQAVPPVSAAEKKPTKGNIPGLSSDQLTVRSHQAAHSHQASAVTGNAAANKGDHGPGMATSGSGCSVCQNNTCTFDPHEPLFELSEPPRITSNFVSSELLGDGVNMLIKRAGIKLPALPPTPIVRPQAGQTSGQNAKAPPPPPALLQKRQVVSGSHAKPPGTKTIEQNHKH